VRFADPMANPHLAFAAMVMAGLDGTQLAQGEFTLTR
jgi:glutamine synthetase